MNTPFENCPFCLVWKAFKNLYPDKDCECWFDVVDDPEDENGHYGVTNFNDDGTIIIGVDIGLRVMDAVEVFAHELAHVAVGADEDHGKKWEDAFDAIFKEYNRIGDEMFDMHTPTKALDAKACRPEEE